MNLVTSAGKLPPRSSSSVAVISTPDLSPASGTLTHCGNSRTLSITVCRRAPQCIPSGRQRGQAFGGAVCNSARVTVFGDLGAEQDRLDGILAGLAAEQWLAESGAAGWTVEPLRDSARRIATAPGGGTLPTARCRVPG